ncbi:MAG TPA: hypothetical protein VFN56_02340 [Candidatus Saccharimonadales bacterium]|nr:hypothetical protein [Candidatus Saccharimonadales bacterium]
MATFGCPCGEIIRTSGSIPNPIEWHIFSDNDWESIYATSQKTGEEAQKMFDMNQQMALLYRCPKSDHLFVFWEGFDKPFTMYEPKER